MHVLTAGLLGLTRVLAPPEASPEGGVRVPAHATSNLGLADEARRLLRHVPRLPEEPDTRLRPSTLVKEVKEASRGARADRPHRVSRIEELGSAALMGREIQLIHAHYRDRLALSRAYLAAREGRKPSGSGLGE